MNKPTLSYLAGFFDGEGCIGIYWNKKNNSFSLHCSVSQKNKTVLKLFKNQFGGSITPWTLKRNCFEWYIASKKAETFLITLLPYLLNKKQVAILALRYRKLVVRRGKNRMPKSVFNKMLLFSKKISRLNQAD